MVVVVVEDYLPRTEMPADSRHEPPEISEQVQNSEYVPQEPVEVVAFNTVDDSGNQKDSGQLKNLLGAFPCFFILCLLSRWMTPLASSSPFA